MATRYHLKYLRLARNLGEPRRVAPALASEAMFVAMAGERAYPRARNLLSQSLAIGARLQDPRITGGTHALDAMCGWLTGRWDLARERGKEAERILRENCAGAWWELSVARNAYARRPSVGRPMDGICNAPGSIQRKTPENRNDLSSLATYRMNHGALSLARDDVEQAERDLLEAQRILANAWSTRGYHIPHFFGTVLPGAGGDLLRQPSRCDGHSHSGIACNARIVPPTSGDHRHPCLTSGGDAGDRLRRRTGR